MTARSVIRMLEAEVGPPKWIHRRKPSFHKKFAALPVEIQAKAKAIFQNMKVDTSRTDLRAVEGNRDLLRITITPNRPGYRAAAHRDGNVLTWFFIGTHNQYDREVMTIRP